MNTRILKNQIKSDHRDLEDDVDAGLYKKDKLALKERKRFIYNKERRLKRLLIRS